MFYHKLENLIHKFNFFSNFSISLIHLINGNIIPYSNKESVYKKLSQKILDPVVYLKDIKIDKNTVLTDNSIFYTKNINRLDKEYFFTSINDESTSLNTMILSNKNNFLCIENLNIEDYDYIKKIISKRYIDEKTLKEKSMIERIEINSIH